MHTVFSPTSSLAGAQPESLPADQIVPLYHQPGRREGGEGGRGREEGKEGGEGERGRGIEGGKKGAGGEERRTEGGKGRACIKLLVD